VITIAIALWIITIIKRRKTTKENNYTFVGDFSV